MTRPRELLLFAFVLASLVSGFFFESLFGGKILSPADVLRVTASFGGTADSDYEPANRLLMDPVLQFQPWIALNRSMIRQGRLPLWNDHAGCGAPHLANGQSAVFDPFQWIAYLGPFPEALAWMAAARLWCAGMGMFLLARSWHLGPWGRWFAGLTFPFCGFLVVWLLYPVTNVAIWMPWIFLATDRVLARADCRGVGWLGLASGLTLLGGHVQTSAHVLLAVGLYVLWRLFWPTPLNSISVTTTIDSALEGPDPPPRRGFALGRWSLGIGLGLMLAAIEIIPLGFYLSRSPVWEDRERERTPAFSLARPRILGSVCTALPYAFGSQRKGHPHLGRALGVDNLNESAGGFAGLGTLIWLAPLAYFCRRPPRRVGFLATLVVLGALGSWRLPPVDNLLRALPVLGVTDNRRLGLWMGFGLCLLGGFGLDRLRGASPRFQAWVACWILGAFLLFAGAALVGRWEPDLRRRATDHYAKAAASTPGADPLVYRARAERQVRSTLAFYPRYLSWSGAQLLLLAGLAIYIGRSGPRRSSWVEAAVVGVVMVDLASFGLGLNPAISARDHSPESPVVSYLKQVAPPPYRTIALGEELVPNTLMRYGLDDARNYDSVELTRNLDYFSTLYESRTQARTSRRDITWQGVALTRARLADASVRAVVATTPPPAGLFARVSRLGSVWVAHVDASDWATADDPNAELTLNRAPGWIKGFANVTRQKTRVVIRQACVPGWEARIDGESTKIDDYDGMFISVDLPKGRHQLDLIYDPPEVRWGLGLSAFGLVALVFTLTVPLRFRSTRIIADGLGRTQAAELESV